jgi:hypothetical protein
VRANGSIKQVFVLTHNVYFLEVVFGQPHPAASDAVGERFTFEKPVSKVYGGYGFADVWRRDHFAWEYKESRGKKHQDLSTFFISFQGRAMV